VSYSKSRTLFDVGKAAQQISSTPWGAKRNNAEILRSFSKTKNYFAVADDEQIAFVRIITDQCFFAYVADLYVERPYRNQGVGRGLIKYAVTQPSLLTVSNWMVTTGNAQDFFTNLGFRYSDGRKNLVAKRCEISLS